MTINEISKKFSLSKDTLRYWEKEKLIPTVKRDKNGYRVYDTKEQNWVFYIMVLRKAGMSIKKLKKFVNLYMKDSSTAEIRKHLLIVQRSQLNKEIINIKKTVNYLDYKIDHFDDQLLSFEKEKLAYEKRI
ncbi:MULTISPECIES: MerR family transcriptional regulator [unclassified Lactobacillus]|uniref:MerR family transcriptional regulator n=1 Tax=unclassified Lactobacillus TaxID=2620435 RepID=UPI0018DCF4F9|nr:MULTISPECIES: MerR family transcriptional regulator [unclassified Lactobacillus]MBH9989895.1 MerR family transcriptional regulator [Lactobacillus sp. M0392]MBI0024445.1 MerR family transcriptional regulator [Lactobacillus sp. W8171]MBI0045087.1 MerR family transcriptional regulator [Lactobacillus sp. M0393]MCT6902842.1 MerR family transcriptional regulator [Lactobacillus sp.]